FSVVGLERLLQLRRVGRLAANNRHSGRTGARNFVHRIAEKNEKIELLGRELGDRRIGPEAAVGIAGEAAFDGRSVVRRRRRGEAVSLSIGRLVLIVTPAENVRRNRGEAGAESISSSSPRQKPGPILPPHRSSRRPLASAGRAPI